MRASACCKLRLLQRESEVRKRKYTGLQIVGSSCLENPMDRGAWWATVHGVAKSRIRLSDYVQHRASLVAQMVENPPAMQET